ncbi:uncharacterized protein STEHIDRAFT_111296 [Stereum hirsutum FP-91666 SS1]|uniref:uncharacterized protein n=1 Tax=Stereum hirsutum (strain FP-91666) TaxID=721885 RepID=UPI0004449F8C|nr:uncharacterized protein STEHIDRAFT_111296 [Stereum hirsutum FP-91666 SS1]EIM86891.1 hypothetical protein STEHIDRAFT_111296 [Stereum hirsutum FP-91666 SS1]
MTGHAWGEQEEQENGVADSAISISGGASASHSQLLEHVRTLVVLDLLPVAMEMKSSGGWRGRGRAREPEASKSKSRPAKKHAPQPIQIPWPSINCHHPMTSRFAKTESDPEISTPPIPLANSQFVGGRTAISNPGHWKGSRRTSEPTDVTRRDVVPCMMGQELRIETIMVKRVQATYVREVEQCVEISSAVRIFGFACKDDSKPPAAEVKRKEGWGNRSAAASGLRRGARSIRGPHHHGMAR